MTEIKLRADEARQMALRVKGEAEEAQSRIGGLQSYLGGLHDSFTGQAAMAFQQSFEQWHTGAVQMLEGLNGLGQFLENAANVIEETDQAIANQLAR